MERVDKDRKIFISAREMDIHPSVVFGTNLDIRLNGRFKVGANSNLGSNLSMRGNNVTIGRDF